METSKIKLAGEWYPLEKNEGGYFRWMGKSGTLLLGNHRYDSVRIRYGAGPESVGERKLSMTVGEDYKASIDLPGGQSSELVLPIKNIPQIKFSIPTFDPGGEDPRKLGWCIYGFQFQMGEDSTYISPDDIEVEANIEIEEIEKPVIEAAMGNPSVDIVSLGRVSQIPFKGVYYIGQYGTCGYASAAKGYLCNFYFNDIPVTWEPLYFDDSKLGDDSQYNLIAKSLINKKIPEYDTIIIHCTPDLWPLLLSQRREVIRNKRIIGYAVWETSKLPEDWVEKMNRSVHEIWCPSTYNKKVFEDSGVTPPITVVPHVFLEYKIPQKGQVRFYSHTKQDVICDQRLTFYNISEMNARKGVEDLIRTYCETFTSYDSVRLLLKVHRGGYGLPNKMYCVSKINEICGQYPSPPKIDYIVNNMTDSQLANLHSIGDCYVSLCKSEGFGLPIYEAYKYGRRIITTGYGGHVDFLGENHYGLVKYKIDKVSGMGDFSKNYTEDAEWAIPDLDHASELMRKEYEIWLKVRDSRQK